MNSDELALVLIIGIITAVAIGFFVWFGIGESNEYIPESILGYMNEGYTVTYNGNKLSKSSTNDLFEGLDHEMLLYEADDVTRTLELIPASGYLNGLLDKGYKIAIDNSVVDNAHSNIRDLLGSKQFVGVSDEDKLIYFATKPSRTNSTYSPIIIRY